MTLKDYITLTISGVALLLSIINLRVNNKRALNHFISLKVLVKGIENDINSIHFSYRSIHLIPWDKDSSELSFQERKDLLQQKIKRFNELLIQDLKIKKEKKEQIFACLNELEDNLFELGHYDVQDKSQLEVAQTFIYSLAKNVENIKILITK